EIIKKGEGGRGGRMFTAVRWTVPFHNSMIRLSNFAPTTTAAESNPASLIQLIKQASQLFSKNIVPKTLFQDWPYLLAIYHTGLISVCGSAPSVHPSYGEAHTHSLTQINPLPPGSNSNQYLF